MTDPSPARVAAERGRSERRNADRWHPSSTQPAEPASPVPAPTPDGQRDAESRDELRAELVELLRRYGLQIPTAQRWLDDFERAVERQIRESIAGEIEAHGRVLTQPLTSEFCRGGQAALAGAARIARGSAS